MRLFKHAKELVRNAKERWHEDRENRAILWWIIGLVIALPSGLFAWYVLLPALVLKFAAWVGHQVWEQVPTVDYRRAILIIIALWFAGWVLGLVLRIVIRGILWAVR